jgi:hypothetical protein
MSSDKTAIVLQRIWEDERGYEIVALLETEADIIPCMIQDRIDSLGEDLVEWGKPEISEAEQATILQEVLTENGHNLWGANWIARLMHVVTYLNQNKEP